MYTNTAPLKRMPYAQAKVLTTDTGEKFLISYSTLVVEIDKDGWATVRGLYSRTTIKHISAFAHEINTDYQTLKSCYIRNLRYNIFTKEFSV